MTRKSVELTDVAAYNKECGAGVDDETAATFAFYDQQEAAATADEVHQESPRSPLR